jgi:hypothetical protein
MVLPFFSPLDWFLELRVRKRRRTSGECPPPVSDPFSDAESGKNLVRLSRQFVASANRRFEFNERSQFFNRTHNETLSLAAMRVSNPDCSAFTI